MPPACPRALVPASPLLILAVRVYFATCALCTRNQVGAAGSRAATAGRAGQQQQKAGGQLGAKLCGAHVARWWINEAARASGQGWQCRGLALSRVGYSGLKASVGAGRNARQINCRGWAVSWCVGQGASTGARAKSVRRAGGWRPKRGLLLQENGVLELRSGWEPGKPAKRARRGALRAASRRQTRPGASRGCCRRRSSGAAGATARRPG